MTPSPHDLKMIYWLCTAVDEQVPGPPDWLPVWKPATVGKANYGVVYQRWGEVILPVFGPTKVPLPIFALVVQGTKNFKDMLEDFETLPLQPFREISRAAISTGSFKAYNNVLDLVAASGVSLRGFLQALPSGVYMIVTGHSLGGNTASVLLPWIAANIPAFGPAKTPLSGLPKSLVGVTFAAPTAGNQAFADFLDDNGQNYFAYFNQNDVVPNVWATSPPLQVPYIINTLFPSPGPRTPLPVQAMLKRKMDELAKAGVVYVQTRGTIFQFPVVKPPEGVDPWMWELDYQHNYAYCNEYIRDDVICKQ